jgi:urea ABC transporter ATP-binding protein UrtE
MIAALKTEALHSGYGRIPVLNGVDLHVAPGEVFGVLGHNGMGKTTLLRTIVGLTAATLGRIWLAGVEIGRLPTYRRAAAGLGYVPQGRQIFPTLTVRDNLRMGCAARRGDADAAIEDILRRFPRLRRLLDRNGGALSGGEQQLLALARCLCGAPKLLLLDEPSEGIQPSIIDEIADILLDIKTSSGVSIVLVEQNVEFLARLADRVLILSRGRIVGEAAGRDITMRTVDHFAA